MSPLLDYKDYKLFEKLVSINQGQIKQVMEHYVRFIFGKENCIITKKYVVGIGTIPIALVAHMDTVFDLPVKDLYYDQKKGVLWSPDGLGADDRAGVFAIIKILQSGFRPSVIFTTDEEKGGEGACELGQIPCPIPNLKYMIELDRQGVDDCVFYDCYNPQFMDYVESFGFQERQGSFSDISFLMSDWNICGVNLSIGYIDEHTYSETLHLKPMLETIKKVEKMLSEEEIPDFKYAELNYKKYLMGNTTKDFERHCEECGEILYEYELFPVKYKKEAIYLCPDCVSQKVSWCTKCGEPFYTDDLKKEICDDCKETTACSKTSKSNLAM